MVYQTEMANQQKDLLVKMEKQGALFRGVFEGSCDALLLLTAKGFFFDCNQRSLEMFGFADKNDFIRIHPSRIYPQLQADGEYSCMTLSKHIATAIMSGVCRYEWVFRRRDGSDFPAKVRLSAFPMGEKTVLQASVRDISESKKVERELGRAQRWTKAILDFFPEAFFAIDNQGKVMAWSRSIERMTGISAGEMIGKGNYEYALPLYGVRRPMLADMMLTPHDEGKKLYTEIYRKGDRLTGEAYASHLCGGTYLSATAGRLYDDEGRIVGAIESFRDISDRKAAEVALQKAKDASDAANRSKSAFLANMSHELRTPLNAIIGYSEMLQEEVEERGADDLIPDLERINSAGKHLLGVINDILDLSKIEANKMDLYLETFSIARMVADVASTVQPLIQNNGNALAVDCPETAGDMHTDLTRVRQCLFNLLSNATKFTRQGDINLAVNRVSEDGQEWIEFSVRDSGIGMTEEQMERLFQPFMQADCSTTRKFGGTGLGLTITMHFCRMMGGDIAMESVHGEGSTFTIRLPAVIQVLPETREAAHDQTETPVLAADATARTVLVIDDDPLMRDLLQRFLHKEGYHVISAGGGEDGLRLARELRPDAITLDVSMPHMDGWEVLSALQSDEVTADIPVIMLTMVDEKNLGYALGATEYLVKPLNRERLLDVLRRSQRDTNRFVLIVEDDEASRDCVRRILEQDGRETMEAENGRIGIEKLEERLPCAVLLDLMMPEMDGFQFVEAVRTREEWREIPIIIVTAKTLTPEDRQRLNGSVAKIIQKGMYSREELLSEVGCLLKNT